MRALVVFESMFGNTQSVAQAIAEGVGRHVPVEVIEVGIAPTTLDPGIRLLVVGGPTHAFSMSRSATRQDAARQSTEPLVSSGIGIREWLELVHVGSPDVRVATFDTHVDKSWVPGAASRSAMKRLRRLGLQAAGPPESFYVEDVTGPLTPGETERAQGWGAQLAQAVSPAVGRV